MPDVELLTDPAEFGAAARALIDADPAVATVVATLVERRLGERVDGWWDPRGDDLWFLVRDHDGRVVGAGMHTAGVGTPYLLAMPDAAAAEIARLVDASGREVVGVNGDLAASTAFGAAWSQRRGVRVRVDRTTRLHEVDRVRRPTGVPGALRPAGPDDLDLVLAWTQAFQGEAHDAVREQRALVKRRIEVGHAWLWCTDRPVSYVGHAVPSSGVVRIAPVFTPPDQRRNGYAGAAVAAVAQGLRDEGLRVCLFTDVANATANHVYAEVGFSPLGDSVGLRFV